MGSIKGIKVLSNIKVSVGSENSDFMGLNIGNQIGVDILMSGRFKGSEARLIKIMTNGLIKEFDTRGGLNIIDDL